MDSVYNSQSFYFEYDGSGYDAADGEEYRDECTRTNIRVILHKIL